MYSQRILFTFKLTQMFHSLILLMKRAIKSNQVILLFLFFISIAGMSVQSHPNPKKKKNIMRRNVVSELKITCGAIYFNGYYVINFIIIIYTYFMLFLFQVCLAVRNSINFVVRCMCGMVK